MSVFFARGISSATITAYRSGQRRYLNFCTQFNLQPIPLQEGTLCRFVAYLACSSLSYQSIRLYLSAIRFLQISYGFPDLSLSSVPHLEYVLKGIRRGLPAHSRPKRLPITPYILRIIHKVWSQDPVDHDKVMLWAACCLAFFGFLRCGEFTCPCLGAYSPTMLYPTDIRVDSHVNPQCLAVHLRQSKTDPFGAGVTLYLGRTGEVLCPVTSVLAYLAIRQATPGPLFIFRDGTPLSRTHFVAAVQQVLQVAGLTPLCTLATASGSGQLQRLQELA